jgi:hypothetical protein
MKKSLKIMIIIIIISILLLSLLDVCNGYRIDFRNVLDNMKDYPDYNYSLGAYPYETSCESNKNEINTLYSIVDFIHKHKKFDYNNNNRDKQNKINIKIIFFKRNNIIQFDLIKNFIEYANKYNIMVGLAALLKSDKKDEIDIYLKLIKLGYTNIFITLASYRDDIDESVDLILKNNGCVRLVKGWYNDSAVKDWSIVTQNYFRNAKKLLETGNYHVLGTHDFIILKNLYDMYGQTRMDNIEIAFFYFNRDFITEKQKDFPYIIKYKQFYNPYGMVCKSALYNMKNSDLVGIFKRKVFKF